MARLAECDTETERVMRELPVHAGMLAKGEKRSRARNAPKFDVRGYLFKVCGVDMSRFPTVKHFTSWLGLCPGTKISGGKILGSRSKQTPTDQPRY